MSLEIPFLLPTIDRLESPPVTHFLTTPTARLPPAPRPAESGFAALFPASWCDHRPRDRIRPCPRIPDRSQPLLVGMECRPNPTTLFAPEKSPFRRSRQAPPGSTSTACVR